MQVYQSPNEIKVSRPVITVGLFDGVHRGHQALIREMTSLASSMKLESLLITFWPHPRRVLHPEAQNEFYLLSTLDEKLHLLERQGVDHCWVIPFTPEFAKISAHEFIREFLTGPFIPAGMITGDDHHFGQGAEGDQRLLKEVGQKHGFEVYAMNTLHENAQRISSTRIRSGLQSGDIESANRLLGYNYLLMGQVEAGKRVGRSIGFPTANIRCPVDQKLIPADGVYVVRVGVEDQDHFGMLNIGFRPTVERSENRTIEAHIFDWTRDLYGKTVRIEFVARIRDEMKFPDLTSLKKQLELDREQAISLLGL